MPNSREFTEYIVDRLSPMGDVRARAMFGGHGLYMDSLMFALIASDTLYLKVDDGTRDRYDAAGLEPFKPSEDRPMTMSYYPVPEEVFEDEVLLVVWAREAYAAALRNRPKSGSRKVRPAAR